MLGRLLGRLLGRELAEGRRGECGRQRAGPAERREAGWGGRHWTRRVGSGNVLRLIDSKHPDYRLHVRVKPLTPSLKRAVLALSGGFVTPAVRRPRKGSG